MQCRACGHGFSAAGNKAAPGVFLGVALALLAASAFGFALPAVRGDVYVCWPILGCALALFCLVQVPIAMGDNKTHGAERPEIQCAECGEPNPLRPWSL